MKTSKILSVALLAVSAAAFIGCSSDGPDTSISVITPDSTDPTELDTWLLANFNKPYNIDFKYRYEDIEGDFDYYLVPARYEDAVTMAHLIKYLCIETYNEVAGTDFTCRYFPKMFYTPRYTRDRRGWPQDIPCRSQLSAAMSRKCRTAKPLLFQDHPP